jgi:hypothetical protein
MNIMNQLFTFFLLVIFGLTAAGQDDCNLKIGTNLAGPTDYNSEWPFVDIFKFSRTWITHNEPSWTGGVPWDPWDTQWQDSIPLDANGYPTHVPFDVTGADTSQVVRTVWANTSQLPSGLYVILYDGEGVIDVSYDGQIISQSPGRIEVEVSGGPNAPIGLMELNILESTLGNHIRNIRFLMPGTEFTYQTDPWSDVWLEKLEPFKTLRFMDWGLTNNSELRNWSDRSEVDDVTYTTRGIPYEWMIEICNLKEADAWVCIPHKASDDYVTQMATLFRDELNPDLKIHLEYSNELWNWIFWQAHYGVDSLDQNLNWPERLAPRIGNVLNIWENVFGNEAEDRLVGVLATQHAWFDIGNRIYQQLEVEGFDHLIDAISPAAYMGVDHATLTPLGSSVTAADIILNGQEFTFDTAEYHMQGWYAHAQLAADKGKKLIFYEGGQHFTPDPWGTVQPYNQAMMEAQSDPLMYDLYQQLFDTLSVLSEFESLLMHYSFISPLWEDPNQGAYGNFGSLASQFYQDEPYTDAPKYRALRDHINGCATTTGINKDKSASEFSIYPNPAFDLFRITALNPTDSIRLSIFNALSETVHQCSFESSRDIHASTLGTPGLYIVRLENSVDGSIEVQKLIVQ